MADTKKTELSPEEKAALNTKNPVELSPEEKDALIVKLQADNAEQSGLIEELAAKTKLSIEVPNVEIDGKTYKIVVPTFFDGKDIVATKDLPENILRGQIGEALIEA